MLNIYPSTAWGELDAPPSKSMTHRLLILAALCRGESVLKNVSESQDVCATIDCLTALGAQLARQGTTVTVQGTDLQSPAEPLCLPCRESASTLRFLIPLALLTGRDAAFTGSPALFARPLSAYEELCARQGTLFRRGEDRLELSGRLKPATYEIPGDVSSQFASGLMLALPFLPQASELRLLPPVESRPYLELTLHALASFGVRVVRVGDERYYIPGAQKYKAHNATVEGDWSNAAYLEALNLLGGRVKRRGLDPYSKQGDRVFRKHFSTLKKGFATVDLRDCPDLGPILFALAAELHGGLFTGTQRLRLKESDRCAAMAEELCKLGAEVLVEDDHVWIGDHPLFAPEEPLDAHGDHRVAMALSVLLTKYGGQLDGEASVGKSFPEFFDVLRALGVRIEDAPPIELPALPEGVEP